MLDIINVTSEFVASNLIPRKIDSHKGDCGRVLVVAGSVGMAGAAILCARAALRSGAGLVTVAVPYELFNIVQVAVPEATCVERNQILRKDSGAYVDRYDAIAIGPGLGVNKPNMTLIEAIVVNTQCPIIIDADGLNTICKYDPAFNIIRKHNTNDRFIITPHPGEANRILQCANKGNVRQLGRDVSVREMSNFAHSVTLIKGHDTLITDLTGVIWCNPTGNPGMATGGSGDVLTGVISGLVAGGLDTSTATVTGAYVHGLAGDIAAEELSQFGMTSGDIVNKLPSAFKILMGK